MASGTATRSVPTLRSSSSKLRLSLSRRRRSSCSASPAVESKPPSSLVPLNVKVLAGTRPPTGARYLYFFPFFLKPTPSLAVVAQRNPAASVFLYIFVLLRLFSPPFFCTFNGLRTSEREAPHASPLHMLAPPSSCFSFLFCR